MIELPLDELVEFRKRLGNRKPRVPEVLRFFVPYVCRHPAWGSLHIVLADGNHEDHSVRHSIGWAIDTGDIYGEELSKLTLSMSKTQRGKVARLASQEAVKTLRQFWRGGQL